MKERGGASGLLEPGVPPTKKKQTVVYKDDYIDIRISSKHVIFDITAICHVIQYQLRYDYYEFNQDYNTIKCYKLAKIKLIISLNHKKPFFSCLSGP